MRRSYHRLSQGSDRAVQDGAAAGSSTPAHVSGRQASDDCIRARAGSAADDSFGDMSAAGNVVPHNGWSLRVLRPPQDRYEYLTPVDIELPKVGIFVSCEHDRVLPEEARDAME